MPKKNNIIMHRRKFINHTGYAAAAIALPIKFPSFNFINNNEDFKKLIEELLKDWCEGLLALQINKPDNPELHGAFSCPACTDDIHGRCMDAVYPFLYMADVHGEKKYIQAAIDVLGWADRNVSSEDGSWRVVPKEGTWNGISVFGAIALAEALKFHGHVLEANNKLAFEERLAKVGNFIFTTYNLTFTNINYGFTAIYALHLLGNVLKKPEYTQRSHELAKGIKNWLTQPNQLIFGEAKPSDAKSAKGLNGVDLGYNVEETINGVILYALEENDTELIALLKKSLEGHLEFMLPDGAWDNSWGTRQYKWSYWGSRTTDGSLPALGLMAHLNPAFGRAAFENTRLLKVCTHNGLLHGGQHFVSHGVKPCVHHTFAHAKSLALFLDTNKNFALIDDSAKLPREKNYGVKHFPELDVFLVSKGPWKATISCYDFIYTHDAQQATGGSLAMLYHQKAGPIFAASMAKYREVEEFNQQPNPLENFTLTPRIETVFEEKVYSNLYDLHAQVVYKTVTESIFMDVNVKLTNEKYESLANHQYQFKHLFNNNKVIIGVQRKGETKTNHSASLILPFISDSTETVTAVSATEIRIKKKNCTLIIQANLPINIIKTEKTRVFNQVPGFEALPLEIKFGNRENHQATCTISVI